jgi:hypothetical protein
MERQKSNEAATEGSRQIALLVSAVKSRLNSWSNLKKQLFSALVDLLGLFPKAAAYIMFLSRVFTFLI